MVEPTLVAVADDDHQGHHSFEDAPDLWSKDIRLSIAPAMALNGWIILDKPVGLGSTQAVGAVKRVMRQAGQPRTRVGHGGTLDPLASGVLPIAIGEATKLVGRVLDAVKAYDFTIRFGEETDTLDLEGQVVAKSDARPSREEIEQILPRFTGPILQTPPAFSALKVDGRRAYDLARTGQAPQLEARQFTVHDRKILPGTGRGTARRAVEGAHASMLAALAPLHHPTSPDGPPPRSGEDFITLSATVSKGTDIRSLARDIAHALGTVGHLTMLRRTRADPFTLSQAISMDLLNSLVNPGDLERAVLPLTAALGDTPMLSVTEDEARLLRTGQRLTGHPLKPGTYLAVEGELPVALVELDAGEISVVRGFNL